MLVLGLGLGLLVLLVLLVLLLVVLGARVRRQIRRLGALRPVLDRSRGGHRSLDLVPEPALRSHRLLVLLLGLVPLVGPCGQSWTGAAPGAGAWASSRNQLSGATGCWYGSGAGA
ncbi:hypothetical protein ACFVT6_34530 [Streptomyces sp. NPDC058049]|uniref:hypothetical protein n=1 Tax=Streptomyces sp. NPDC058049 TaxID=3346314 RepID=UPI0036E3DDA9